MKDERKEEEHLAKSEVGVVGVAELRRIHRQEPLPTPLVLRRPVRLPIRTWQHVDATSTSMACIQCAPHFSVSNLPFVRRPGSRYTGAFIMNLACASCTRHSFVFTSPLIQSMRARHGASVAWHRLTLSVLKKNQQDRSAYIIANASHAHRRP